jgi:DNA mismatch endonuclease Vsr
MDKLTPEQRRKNMQAVKSTGSKIEVKLITALSEKGLQFETHLKSIEGKPDIYFPDLNLAVFCDSEFWHGKNWEERKHDHKSNEDFWLKKISGNIERDKVVNKILKKQGISVLRFWGKDILKETNKCTSKIFRKIKYLKKKSLQNE